MSRNSLLYLSIYESICTCKVGVWVDGGAGHVVLLGKALALVDESDDGVELLVSLAQGGFELGMGVNQTLIKYNII